MKLEININATLQGARVLTNEVKVEAKLAKEEENG